MLTKIKRFIFIDYLRALAISFVTINHWLGSFWQNHLTIARESFFHPIKTLPITSPLSFLYHQQINLGLVGVFLFFLISGFLVPWSIENKNKYSFLIIRFFRLFPTYLVSFLIIFLFLSISAYYNKIAFNFSVLRFFGNVLLIQDWLYKNFFDRGIWVLLVLIKYYLIAIFIYKKGSFDQDLKMIIFAFFFLFLSSFTNLLLPSISNKNLFYGLIFTPAYSLSNIIFIFLGSGFYYLYQARWSLKKSLLFSLIVYFIVYYSFKFGLKFNNVTEIVHSYNLSLVIFTIFFIFSFRLSSLRLVNFISSISYPFYLVHRLPGYIIIGFLIKYKVAPFISIAITLLITTVLAYLIHQLIEEPFYNLGKKILKLSSS